MPWASRASHIGTLLFFSMVLQKSFNRWIRHWKRTRVKKKYELLKSGQQWEPWFVGDKLTFRSYLKIQAPQAKNRLWAHWLNCANGWRWCFRFGLGSKRQVSVFNSASFARPIKLAFFDRSPIITTDWKFAGRWFTDWYRAKILGKGLRQHINVLPPGVFNV